jgi:translation initiation factor 4E
LCSTNNLSLSTNQTDTHNTTRDFSSLSRRNGGATSSHGRANPFSATTPVTSLASPGGASNAFGLGSGAFAAFGSAKTPKTPGNPFELAMGSGNKTPTVEKSSKDALKAAFGKPPSAVAAPGTSAQNPSGSSHPLQDGWVFWTRPPISKANGYIDYEKTLHPMAEVSTGEEFWTVFRYLVPPSQLGPVTDYHLFKKGVRPIWEDAENKKGGKWVLRLKKGVADRYWENILLGLVGSDFGEEYEEVNGAVLSVRHGEDIISIWTTNSNNSRKLLKIRYGQPRDTGSLTHHRLTLNLGMR